MLHTYREPTSTQSQILQEGGKDALAYHPRFSRIREVQRIRTTGNRRYAPTLMNVMEHYVVFLAFTYPLNVNECSLVEEARHP